MVNSGSEKWAHTWILQRPAPPKEIGSVAPAK